jgi:hypothetical protein
MKKTHQHLTELEETAWVLVAIFLMVLLMFSYLFWKRISREEPRASQSQEVLPVPYPAYLSLSQEFTRDFTRAALSPGGAKAISYPYQ